MLLQVVRHPVNKTFPITCNIASSSFLMEVWTLLAASRYWRAGHIGSGKVKKEIRATMFIKWWKENNNQKGSSIRNLLES